jgi:hypothetical protein
MKLSPHFFGLFRALDWYHGLQVEPSYRCSHPSVFHISCLKKKLGQQSTPLLTLPPIDHNGEVRPKPKNIVDRCLSMKNGRALTEALIHLKGAPLEDDTWENQCKMQEYN